MTTPMIDGFLKEYEPDGRGKEWKDVEYLTSLAAELRAQMSERDRLNELVDALKADQQASLHTSPRRLREHKGVTYQDGCWESNGSRYSNVFVALAEFFEEPTNADHAALLDLKANPYEPVETLEEVVQNAHDEWYTMLRPALAFDEFVSARLRAWMAQQTPTHNCETWRDEGIGCKECNPIAKSLSLTAADHVNALVAMGAREMTMQSWCLSDTRFDEKVIVLPTTLGGAQ